MVVLLVHAINPVGGQALLRRWARGPLLMIDLGDGPPRGGTEEGDVLGHPYPYSPDEEMEILTLSARAPRRPERDTLCGDPDEKGMGCRYESV